MRKKKEVNEDEEEREKERKKKLFPSFALFGVFFSSSSVVHSTCARINTEQEVVVVLNCEERRTKRIKENPKTLLFDCLSVCVCGWMGGDVRFWAFAYIYLLSFIRDS